MTYGTKGEELLIFLGLFELTGTCPIKLSPISSYLFLSPENISLLQNDG